MAPRTHTLIRITSILLVAFAIRVIDIGQAAFQGDEVLWSFMSYKWGHEGERFALGPVGSRDVNLPPFFTDVFAPPFALSHDPRIARLYMAALHLLSLALLYAFTKRYWGERPAFWVLILYAALPSTIWESRYVWNLNLVAPLMIFYLYSGFMAMDGLRRGYWLHPLGFVLVVQGHPAGIVYALTSVLFYGIGWWHTRRIPLTAHLIGGSLALLAILPWLIGLLNKASESVESTTPVTDGGSSWSRIFNHMATVHTYIEFGPFSLPENIYQAPFGTEGDYAMRAFGWLIFASAVFFILRWLWQPTRFREGVLGAVYLCLPLCLIFLPVPSYVYYMNFMIPIGALLLGLWLSQFRAGQVAMLFCAGVSVGLVLDAYQQIRAYQHFDRDSMLSLNDMMEVVETAHESPYEVVYLAEGAGAEEYEQALAWQILSGGERIIWGNVNTLPVDAAGITYVGYTSARHIPEFYGNRPVQRDFKRLYQMVTVPANSTLTPTCAATTPNRLTSGATIDGFAITSQPFPHTNEAWRIFVLWHGENQQAQRYQLFAHLVDAQGNRLAQQDVELPGTLTWRADEQMVTEIRLTIPAELPAPPDTLRVGMYILLPTFVNASVLDDAGNPVGQWVDIPVCTG